MHAESTVVNARVNTSRHKDGTSITRTTAVNSMMKTHAWTVNNGQQQHRKGTRKMTPRAAQTPPTCTCTCRNKHMRIHTDKTTNTGDTANASSLCCNTHTRLQAPLPCITQLHHTQHHPPCTPHTCGTVLRVQCKGPLKALACRIIVPLHLMVPPPQPCQSCCLMRALVLGSFKKHVMRKPVHKGASVCVLVGGGMLRGLLECKDCAHVVCGAIHTCVQRRYPTA